jgi:hypothetical protein
MLIMVTHRRRTLVCEYDQLAAAGAHFHQI